MLNTLSRYERVGNLPTAADQPAVLLDAEQDMQLVARVGWIGEAEKLVLVQEFLPLEGSGQGTVGIGNLDPGLLGVLAGRVRSTRVG